MDDSKPEYTDDSAKSTKDASAKSVHDTSAKDVNDASDRSPQDADIVDPPPPFAPYEAEHFINHHNDIISHDHHLNHDGEALYQFILQHSQERPAFFVSLSGTHQEQRQRISQRMQNGRTITVHETYHVTVTDFDFSIDLVPNIVSGPLHWSFADEDAAYRGLMVRQVLTPTGLRKATKEEIATYKRAKAVRQDKGLPPWAEQDGGQYAQTPLESSKSLRELIDEYAASPKILKEFEYKKVIYGWDTKTLEAAIKTAIRETQYRGNVSVLFRSSGTRIFVRPDNRLSRVLSHTLYKVLLSLILVYPFLWLFKRYHSRGGGRWKVYGGAYALKHVEPLSYAELGDIVPDGQPPSLAPRVVSTENGPVRIVGLREGEWFKEWENAIKRSVAVGVRRAEPLTHRTEAPVDPALYLDGYTPSAGEF